MSPVLRRLFFCCVLVVFVTASVFAQTESRGSEAAGASNPATPAKNTPVNPKYTTPKSPLDTAYGAKIAEYTTENTS